MRFDELKIDPAFKEISKKLGFEELTAIQEKAIPEILLGKDVAGQAETGSGKTIAFALPILNDVFTDEGIQVLVLTPTRELCIQVSEVFKEFGDPVGIETISIYGGISINPQIKALETANVIVGTPGRMLDHINRKTLDFKNLKFLVLDEADRMFDMGFIEDVEDIISYTPKDIQVTMFSATISDDIYWVMDKHMNNPLILKTKSEVDPAKLKQSCYDIYEQKDKFSLIVHLLKNKTDGLAIVFCATRHEAEFVARNLREQKINAAAIHGGMSQPKRIEALNKLKNEKIDVLVATDVAARGLDIKNVTHVYNYDVPGSAKDYVHRIGRTARAGEMGSAVTLLTSRDHDNYRNINRDYGKNIEMIKLPEFEKIHVLQRSSNEKGNSGGQRRGGGGSRGYRGGSRGSSGNSRGGSGGSRGYKGNSQSGANRRRR